MDLMSSFSGGSGATDDRDALAAELKVYRSMLDQHRKQLEVAEAALAAERESNHDLRREVEALRNSEHGSGLFSWSWGADGGGGEREARRLHARVTELEAKLAAARAEIARAQSAAARRSGGEGAGAGRGGSGDDAADELASLRKRLDLEERRHEASLELLAQARDPVFASGAVGESEMAQRLEAESAIKMKFFALAKERDELAKDDAAMYERRIVALEGRVAELEAELAADSGRTSLNSALRDAQRKLLETAIARDALRNADTDELEEAVQARVAQLLNDALRMHISVPNTLDSLPASPGEPSTAAAPASAADMAALEDAAANATAELEAARETIAGLEDDVEHLEGINASLRAQLQAARAASADVSQLQSNASFVDPELLETENELLEKLLRAQAQIDSALDRSQAMSPRRSRTAAR
ncbi:uncharacterized protein AMSG_10022 [Thecamonas trahens ATCC 50062]|uniref:Uncharacterized protein n=1 Tax=Thecamonas trahens ATCC 50062 TaxID=461836 RepID=A0A0L0DPP9_THETB|nr:hypothetical protein AMSG_10022 [Thecamonas trahens ATCC 50062]KNC54230.1 hypothetical protein AMSG_10022 [Thecamonas trahens ATCC 50062]|eukprot:XP_013753868.1 hypothetical protein AMSG_10022 [Thecamonas trahens ATCC 50062]